MYLLHHIFQMLKKLSIIKKTFNRSKRLPYSTYVPVLIACPSTQATFVLALVTIK